MKLLITSVGSLLGQNILDCIESRRDKISVIGLNSVAENPRNFRCDKVFLVNSTSHPRFYDEFSTILDEVNPDFILPGRDEDCIFLSHFKEIHPGEFEKRIPFGSSTIPRITKDKYLTHLFCKKNQLPFADTILLNEHTDKYLVNHFIESHGFPLVVKPREGFGSHGVYFVLNLDQLNELRKEGDVLVQEYLGSPETILKYRDQLNKGIPLFFMVEEKEQYAAQTMIFPYGTMGDVFITVNSMVMGRAEYSKQIVNKEIEQIVKSFSKAFYENGWYGPINFQLKPDRSGTWKVFELNSRLTGTSSGRALLGYDEFGLLTSHFIPEFQILNLTKTENVKGHVIKYLQDHLLLDENVEKLKEKRVWTKF